MLDKIWIKDTLVMRQIKHEDIDTYYEQNFKDVDPYLVKFTRCKEHFTKSEITNFINNNIKDDTRYDFIILNNNIIIGESVLCEINHNHKSAHFRIAIFNKNYRGLGIGKWATNNIIDFGFNDLNLNQISLEVFSFNTIAKHMYESIGFIEECSEEFYEDDNKFYTISMTLYKNKETR